METDHAQQLIAAAKSNIADLDKLIVSIGLEDVTNFVVRELISQSMVETDSPFELRLTHQSKTARRLLFSNTFYDNIPEQLDFNSFQEEATDILRLLFNQPSASSAKHVRGFLKEVHRRLEPNSYLEIGVASGGSLCLSRCKSIGIDPEFKIREEIECDVSLHKVTSDEYFRRSDIHENLENHAVDLAFIDGMHLMENAVRDFINVERVAHHASVIIFDDVLPTNARMASRQRKTMAWTGDVFKILYVLKDNRPDLIFLPIDTWPTGLLIVLGANPSDVTLQTKYHDVIRDYMTPDPQDVPAEICSRKQALDPVGVLESPIWETMRNSRPTDTSRKTFMEEAIASLSDIST